MLKRLFVLDIYAHGQLANTDPNRIRSLQHAIYIHIPVETIALKATPKTNTTEQSITPSPSPLDPPPPEIAN
jgi:hypothetical protein